MPAISHRRVLIASGVVLALVLLALGAYADSTSEAVHCIGFAPVDGSGDDIYASICADPPSGLLTHDAGSWWILAAVAVGLVAFAGACRRRV